MRIMPVKPVTHNKYSDMKRYTWIWIMLIALLSGCEDDFDKGGSNPGEGVTEGMITFRFSTEEAPVIVTRVGETGQQESLENVLVMVFDKDGKLVNKAYQQLTIDNHSVNIYLTAVEDQSIYALCNLPEGDETEDLINNSPVTLTGLKAKYTTIRTPEGAYGGKHIMTGSLPLELTTTGQLKKEYTIPVKRLTAQVNFNVSFEPYDPEDKFAVGEMFLYNIPMGSMLLDGGGSVDDAGSWGYRHPDDALLDSLDICAGDYSYVVADNAAKADRSAQFYQEGKRLDFEIVKGAVGTNDTYTASFKMFENRQGRVYDRENNWENLKGLIGKDPETAGKYGYEDLYRYYQQINKRGLAGTSRNPDDAEKIFKRNEDINDGKYTVNAEERGFKYATYLMIRGVYTKKNPVGGEDPSNVTYYIYLGSDNYKDFNVCRNHVYNYRIRIFDADKTDTRVDANPIGGLTIYGDFEDVLDAHPNVTQVLLYSPSNWTVRVADPDQTPWLEVSASPSYKPRKLGAEASRDQAAFRLDGEAGLHYFYIHTDEYIPPIKDPHGNVRYFNAPRTGKLLFSNQAGNVKEVEIKQYAAQMVIRERFATDLAKKVLDTLYVERILEKKNMQWGFQHYWCLKMDEILADDLNSKKNGLTNTRVLYDIALNGDKWGIDPAYPDGNIPSNIALGYALGKNRDRNGNGKIDYNEILWYLPAYTELQAIAGHISGGSRSYPGEYSRTVDVDWEMEPYSFFSSTPSSSDAAGITAGFSWAVQFSPNPQKNGKARVEMRSRFYNVICARRYNGWRGPDTGTVDGEIDTDEDWNEDEEEIMDKK